MKIAYGIITSAERSTFQQTLESLSRGAPGTQFIICKDLEKGLLPNHIASWRKLAETGADYCVLFQDDILASKGWDKALKRILEKMHYHMLYMPMITLYSARVGITKDMAKKVGFAHLPEFINEQALCVATEVVVEFLKYHDTGAYKQDVPEKDWKHCDVLWGAFFKKNKINVVATSPSFVQHVGRDSVVGHNWKVGGRERQSQYWLGEDYDLEAHYKKFL